ncbi:glutathione S-transferase N-terminal domain-containing protein [Alphaproteobacteria bacterium]|nr:glutathione S-transferase N-terminal domain-containing protein [Alphaproteobacteria bacterium]
MIQLYGRRNSINVQKVSWALCELNIEFKWHDEHGKFGTVNVENYEKLNPQMIVPTLDHNGTIINQSNSIVRYLYRKYTDVYEISKVEDIAIAEQWMEFQATDLQLNMTPIFWGLVRNPPEDRDQDLIDKNIILLNKKFEIFDNFLEGHEYILNNSFGMSDIIMGVATYRYNSLPIERPNLVNLQNWYKKISNRNCFKKNILGTFS